MFDYESGLCGTLSRYAENAAIRLLVNIGDRRNRRRRGALRNGLSELRERIKIIASFGFARPSRNRGRGQDPQRFRLENLFRQHSSNLWNRALQMSCDDPVASGSSRAVEPVSCWTISLQAELQHAT